MIARALIADCLRVACLVAFVAGAAPTVAMAAPKTGAPASKVTAKPPPPKPVAKPATPKPPAPSPIAKPPAKPVAKPPAKPPLLPAPKPPVKTPTTPATTPPLVPTSAVIADAGDATTPSSASSAAPSAAPAAIAPVGSSVPSGSASATAATRFDAGASDAASSVASATSATPAHAELPPARLVIDFATPSSGPAWFVTGLEDVVGNELRRFHSVELAPKIDAARCPTRDPRCLVDQYRASKVDVIILGKLEPRTALKYQVYDTWTGTRAFEGVLAVSGVSSSTLEREIGDIVRPIVQRGGLVDLRPPAASSPNAPPTSATKAPAKQATSSASGHALEIFVGAMFLLVLSPILLALMLVGGAQLGRREKPASWKWSALVLLLLAGVPIATSTLDIPAVYARVVSRAPPLLGLLPPALAGMLWGAFALSLAVWLFAPVHGLERIRHDALWPLLRSWSVLVFLRTTAIVFLYAPIAVFTLWTCAAIALPDRMTLAFVLPAVGLITHFWLLSLVDNLTLYLDSRLVIGLATPRNPWHATIRRYFLGYVKRNVVAIDEKVLERTLFLPSIRADVLSYGGGFARPRVLIGEKPLETALGELPDEEEFPDRAVNAEELPLGLLMPTRTAADDAALLARSEQWRRKVTLSPPRHRAYMPRLLGENATLLGWIAPQSIDKGLPLISDTEEDFGVVKRLLGEHYSAFEGILQDDEVDDSDPTQKDFLFGALLREIGVIVRHDVYFGTLGWTIAVMASGPAFFAKVVRLPLSLYERFFAAPAAKIADAYAALNGGLHHLVQYLCYLRGADPKLLTTRANMPRLIETSRTMLARLERDAPKAEERDAFRATPRDRADWLTTVFQAGMAPRRIRLGRILGTVAIAILAGFFLVRSVRESIAYHPTYVERMKSKAAESTPPQGDNAR